jgi:hypothetical protein
MTYRAKSRGFYETKLYIYGALFFPPNGFWGFINSGKSSTHQPKQLSCVTKKTQNAEVLR